MRIIQRASALVAWLALFATGLFLIAEGTGIAGGGWRETVAEAAEWIDRPDLARWAAALLGVLIGALALVVLVAQFVPARMTGRSFVVDRSAAGATTVNAAAIRRGVTERIRRQPGVVGASPTAHGRRLSMEVEIGQGANADSVWRGARAQLDLEFWSLLGAEANPVDLHLRYVPQTQQETA